jgi:hypothetical protein
MFQKHIPYNSVSQTEVHGCLPGGLWLFKSGPQTVSEQTALQELYHTLNKRKIHSHMSVFKLYLLVDLQQKVGKQVLSITSCTTITISEDTLN